MSFTELNTKQIIDEIQRTRSDLKNAIDASEARIQLKIEESYERIRKLEAENSFLKEKVERLERQQISNNIIIFGLNKERNEVSFDLLRDELKSLLQIEISIDQIKNISCLGFQKNCPVKVEFLSSLTKKYLLANCKKLKGTGISIAHDLTVQQRKELVVLKRHLQTHRQNKCNSFIKGNKLVVDGVQYTVDQLLQIEQEKEYSKRGKTSSVPSTPTQPLIREIAEEEIEKFTQPAETGNKTTVDTTPKATGSSKNLKKLLQKPNVHNNNEKVKTRSCSEKNK